MERIISFNCVLFSIMNLHIGCIADAMTMSTNGVHNQGYIHDVTQ